MSFFQNVMQGNPQLPPAYSNILKRAVEGQYAKEEGSEEIIEADFEEVGEQL
jgi:hypothetical protein